MVVGAVNWLLVGLLRFDLVRWAVGRRSFLGRIIYDLVGVAGLTQLTTFVTRSVRGQMATATGEV